ncbi:type II secretion system F family protein [Natronosporangium hydrolyticum]|uniref:Type II secretion system F family protein n=1 Tax=Natronosporangium hydrolyticum TaxID=2811111 RepID=A0A895YTY2_9ACTN|nr:type II secretion system F family protein [Natronosporangium hydrolyticum]QSB17518.1 type II secretion system F family protein [Natronosporangium hydrolyticum]
MLALLLLGAPAVTGRRRPGRRLRALSTRAAQPGGSGRPSVDPRRIVAVLVGVAVAVLVEGWLGPVLAAPLAVGVDRGLRRLESPAQRVRRATEAASLPLAADLLAVALRGGAPVDAAVAATAAALGGPLGDRLDRVARLLRLGATAEEAWQQLSSVPGAPRLVRAAVRSAEHGAALSDSFARLAADLRADRATTVEAAARRAGVLIVLPLGLCFLPAFMLAGLVPVIIAALGDYL